MKILMECQNSDNLQLGLFFWVARTSYFYFGFTLNISKLWEVPAVVFFCNMTIFVIQRQFQNFETFCLQFQQLF